MSATAEIGARHALVVEGLHKSFGKLEVLRGIDLTVDEHEVVFVGGDEITAEGVKVDRIRRRIGIVYQAFNLFPHMSVLNNVTLAPRKVLRRPKAQAEAEALAVLERFGLADKAREFPDRLSGGQQQRVATSSASWR